MSESSIDGNLQGSQNGEKIAPERRVVVEFRIARNTEQIGDFRVSKELLSRLDLPAQFDLNGLQKAQRDAEILGRKLANSPDDLMQVLTAACAGDMASAKEKLGRLGLREQDFEDQGGGLIWLVVIAVLLYATDAY